MAAQQQAQAPGGDAHGPERVLQKRAPIAVFQEEQIIPQSVKQDDGADRGHHKSDVPHNIRVAVGYLRGAGDAALAFFALSFGAVLFLRSGGGAFHGFLRLRRNDHLLGAGAIFLALIAVRQLGKEHDEAHRPCKGEQEGNDDPRPQLVIIRFFRLSGVSALVHGSIPPAQYI